MLAIVIQAHDGFNDVELDPEDTALELFLIMIPRSLMLFIVSIFLALLSIFIYSYQYNRSMRGGPWSTPDKRVRSAADGLGGYNAIPDVEMRDLRADVLFPQ